MEIIAIYTDFYSDSSNRKPACLIGQDISRFVNNYRCDENKDPAERKAADAFPAPH
jgi:hypothetical protein